jgi:hypothetical protein
MILCNSNPEGCARRLQSVPWCIFRPPILCVRQGLGRVHSCLSPVRVKVINLRCSDGGALLVTGYFLPCLSGLNNPPDRPRRSYANVQPGCLSNPCA